MIRPKDALLGIFGMIVAIAGVAMEENALIYIGISITFIGLISAKDY